MDYCVLGLRDREQWLQELDKLRDIIPDLHYQPKYLALFGSMGEARLFIYHEGTETVIYPFFLRKVNLIPGLTDKLPLDLYDITSAYGYGGPLATPTAGDNVLSNFYRCFAKYCNSQHIITEFIRFHPVLGNHRLMKNHVEVERVSSVVCVDLRGSVEEIWSGYQRNNRKNINKAYREGLEVILEEAPAHFTDFLAIYHHTLTRRQAGNFYYFNTEFYEYLHRELRGNFLYAHTLMNGRVISTELLLYNESYIHSFLGGTLEQFYEYRPNNILKHEVIKWAKSKGIKYFLLGGGYQDEDGIFRYKLSFASNGVLDFYVGKKVHNHGAVSRLEEIMASKKPRENEGYFPGYRRY
ncbi:GNAT family N-acetyltransferase [Desulfotruncus alcoholivorax]|uniref:GNAT family N-acetyltransferase n=1 Tax=Desulfotruncus alcoholivorax TaxID=265477 RepID=UPI0003F79711|nr:GNAT family N-acetyltransferase [Desulfotruncus alcoholivorax]